MTRCAMLAAMIEREVAIYRLAYARSTQAQHKAQIRLWDATNNLMRLENGRNHISVAPEATIP